MKKPTTARAVTTTAAPANGTVASQDASTAQPAAAKAAPAQTADQLLKADHRKVEQLFKKFEGLTQSAEKADCVQEICKELIIHAQLEEEIFYPACRQKAVKSDMLDEAQVEHDGAKVMIRELLDEEPEAEFYDAKVTVLSEYIKHHVGEEEKGSEGIFALAKAAGVDMSALGSELQARKAELMAEFEEEEPPPPEFRSLHVIQGRNTSRQEKKMPRYESEDRGNSSRGGRSNGGRERDEQGRFMSDDDDRGMSRSRSSRYDDDDNDRRGSYGSRSGSSRGRYEDDDNGRGYGSRSSGYRDRDEYGRFTGDDDNGRGYGSRSAGNRDRDEYGRFTGDDDNGRGYGSRSAGYRDRDEYGRFASDDDDGRGYGSRSSGSRGRHEDDDRDYRSSSSRGSSRYDDDERGQGQGWYGDSEGHAEAARRGWEHRSGSGSSRSSGRYDDDDRRGSLSGSSRSGGSSRSSQGSSHGGWFGDSRGHAEAARRGWRNRD